VPLPDEYFVAKMPTRPHGGNWLVVVDDGHEVTVVGGDGALGGLSADVKGPFRALRLEIATPFEAPGFIAAATAALAEEKVNVLVFSTFSFDYVLVEAEMLDRAIEILGARGFPGSR